LPDGTRGEEVNGYGRPDQSRAYRREQRQEGHENTPEHRPLDAQCPENEPSKRTLAGRDNEVALDGGADHGGEFVGQLALVVAIQGHGMADAMHQCRAIAQQEEQQIQHHAKAYEKLHRVLAYVQGLRGDELADLSGSGGQSCLHFCGRGQMKMVQKSGQGGG
jgi:hypothetical protein